MDFCFIGGFFGVEEEIMLLPPFYAFNLTHKEITSHC